MPTSWLQVLWAMDRILTIIGQGVTKPARLRRSLAVQQKRTSMVYTVYNWESAWLDACDEVISHERDYDTGTGG